MERRAMITFCAKLKKMAMKRLNCLKVRVVKNVFPENVCSHGIQESKKDESIYKTINENAFHLTEQKNSWKPFHSRSRSQITTDSQSAISLGVRPLPGIRDQFFFILEIFFRQFLFCYFVALSLTRGRVCNLL
jgi:hypothetical protein